MAKKNAPRMPESQQSVSIIGGKKSLFRYKFINYKIEISKGIVKMGTSFEDILNRMKSAPHNGIPKVTNPKVPTTVERDAAAFAERVKNNPIIPTSSGSQLDEILERMRDSSHGGMVYADPAFKQNIDHRLLDGIRCDYQEFLKIMSEQSVDLP